MRGISLLFIAVLCLCACQPKDPAPKTALVLIQDTGIKLELSPADAPVETPLTLQLTAENVLSVHAEIIGLSMYMGRIPVRFTRQQELWHAEFLLGACSDPKMAWQLQLELEFTDGKKRILKQQFHSSWR